MLEPTGKATFDSIFHQYGRKNDKFQKINVIYS